VPESERQRLGQAVLDLGKKTALCARCFNIMDLDTLGGSSTLPVCNICGDSSRDQSVICVVEEPLDLVAFEKTGKYRGLYHVLHGVIAPLEHIGPEDLKIDELIRRIENLDSGVSEIILATNPSLEGEATAMYIKQLINNRFPVGGSRQVKITRIARGIPTGGDLEYADEVTLAKALEGRSEF